MPLCHGQCPSNRSQFEITASYGLIRGSQFTDNLSSSGTSGGKTITSASGNAFLSGRYFLFNRLALGFSGGTATEKGHYTDRTDPSIISSTYSTTYTTVAMELYYIYYFRKYLEVYTLAGFGPTFTSVNTITDHTPNPSTTVTTRQDKVTAQYTPAGIRIGGRLAGFIELGIGYKGLINGGISYKFGSPCWWRQ